MAQRGQREGERIRAKIKIFITEPSRVDSAAMSAREIIAQLPGLTVAELRAVEQRIVELTSLRTSGSRASDAAEGLRAERIAGRLVLAGPRVVRQAEVESILDDFP
jgi:hypothetical protein